jgi:hypothetical protein
MTMAEEQRPEANRHIEFRPYAQQRHTRYEYKVDLSLSILAEYRLVTYYISKAMLNSNVDGEACNCVVLLIISCDKY